MPDDEILATDDTRDELFESDTAETLPETRRHRRKPVSTLVGRPRADGIPPGLSRPRAAGDPIPNPRFNRYFSDDINPTKRTQKLWEWWKSLPQSSQDMMMAYVYRDYPPLIDVPEDVKQETHDYNYIDKLTVPLTSDQDLNDRYGAGDFHIFLNVEVPPYKRTLATAFIKGNRDFKSMPPADRRISELGEDGFPKHIDRNDPQCKSYVEYLRGRGVIPELYTAEKEKMQMDQAQTAKESMSAVERMADKVIAMAESKAAAAPAKSNDLGVGSDTIKNVIDASLSGARASTEMLTNTIKTLQDQAINGKNGNNDATAMLQVALQIATEISKANNPAEYLKIISEQNTAIAKLQMDVLNTKIEAITRTVAPAPAANPGGVGGLKGMLEDLRAVKDILGDFGGAADVAEAVPMATGWAGMIERSLPHLTTLGGQLLQMYMASQIRPTGPQMPMGQPMGQPMPQPAAPQPQAQPPAPSPGGQVIQMQPAAIPAPQAQPQANGAPGPDASQVLAHVLNTIQVPFSNQLHDGLDGDDFADWFVGGFGEKIWQELVAYGEGGIVMGLYSYPPIAQRIVDVPRERVEKFVHEFCTFNGEEYDQKRERANKEPTPIA